MNQTVKIAPFSARTAEGRDTYGSDVTVAARVQPYTRMMRRSDGEELKPSAKIFVEASVSVGLHDQVTLPDGTKLPVLEVSTSYGAYGPSHKVVIV